MLFLRLSAMVRTDRNAAIHAATEAIQAAGGWITDHALYSDVMAVLNFQVPGDRTGDLGRALADAGIAATPPPPGRMGTPDQDVSGQLTLTFPGGTGDLRRDVPAFH